MTAQLSNALRSLGFANMTELVDAIVYNGWHGWLDESDPGEREVALRLQSYPNAYTFI